MQANLEFLTIVVGWIVTVFIGALGLVILWRMVTGKIDLKDLISEKDGKASLSRFQFLVFTFVIALSLILVILGQPQPGFPAEIPPGVFALLGISGGSYVISKAIQTNRDINLSTPDDTSTSSKAPPPAPPTP